MKSLVSIVLLAFGATAFAGQPLSRETHKVLYLADSGIIVIQMEIQIEGQSPNQRFEAFVDSLMSTLDKDKDGVVTVDEAKGKILTAREAQQMQLAPTDTNPPDLSPDVSPKDGKISRAELLAYFKRIGVLPFSVRFQQRGQDVDPNTGMANQAGEAPLFDRLDINGDKKLSVEELTNALEVLRKLDRDGDETISVAELQPLAAQPRAVNRAMNNNAPAQPIPFVSLASGESIQKLIRRVIDKYDSADAAKSGVPSLSTRNQKLSPRELGWSDEEFAKFDVDGDGQLDFTELRQFISSLEPTLELVIDVTDGKVQPLGASAAKIRMTADGAANLQFGAAQISILALPAPAKYDAEVAIKPLFMAADADANGYLEKSEAPDGSLYGATFADLDIDKNGKLYLDEILDYMKPRLDAARSRVELTIVEQGRTLFDILDSDRDGRLAHREVRSVADKLALWDTDDDGQLSESEIPLQFRMVAAQASLPNLGFRPDVGGPNQRGRRESRAAGPVWFRKMDRNSDGEISRREFLGDLDLFEKLDLNHDGAIELSEALQAKSEK